MADKVVWGREKLPGPLPPGGGTTATEGPKEAAQQRTHAKHARNTQQSATPTQEHTLTHNDHESSVRTRKASKSSGGKPAEQQDMLAPSAPATEATLSHAPTRSARFF